MLGALVEFLSDKTRYRTSFEEYQKLLSLMESGESDIDREKFEKALSQDPRLLDHYTPNPFASLIVNSIKKTPSKVLDPCCGLANILHCLSHTFSGLDLTGVEINKGVSSVAQYLVPESKIINSDFFQFFPENKYGLIVGTLPFGPRINFKGRKMKIQNAFIIRSLELLEEGGEAFFLTAYDVLSYYGDSLVKNDLLPHVNSVTTLPGVSAFKSSIKTYLIHLTKDQSEYVSFGSVQHLQDLKTEMNQNVGITIPKSELADHLYPEYYISRNSDKYNFLEDFETRNLEDFAEIVRGAYIKKEEKKPKGKFLILRPSEINNEKVEIDENSRFLDVIDPKHSNSVAHPGDILVSTFFNQSKIYVVKDNDPALLVSNNLVILRSSNTDYLQVYLNTEEGKKIFNLQAKDLATGSVIPNLSINNLKKIQIPIVPLKDLNKLGDKFIESADKEELEELREKIEYYRAELAQKEEQLNSYESFKQIVENRSDKILEELQKTNQKIDQTNEKIDLVLNKLEALQEDFIKIKNTNREDEEKVIRMLSSLDRRMKAVLDEKRETIEEYVELTKKWLFYWEELHPSSQKFLPLAEFLYDELCSLQDADYSPFILQYCRTLENEILIKVFQKYHEEGLIGVDTKELTSYDLNPDNKSNAFSFAKQIKRNDAKYPLGNMHWILNLLKPNGSTFKNSPLLQHFNQFLSRYFNEELTSQEFLNQIQRIQKDYRNKAAHVSTLDLKSADECRDLLRKSLSRFFELRN